MFHETTIYGLGLLESNKSLRRRRHNLAPGASRDVSISIDVAESVEAGVASGTIIVASTRSVAKQQMDFEITIEGDGGNGTAWELNIYMMIGILLAVVIVFALIGSTLRKKDRANGGTR